MVFRNVLKFNAHIFGLLNTNKYYETLLHQ